MISTNEIQKYFNYGLKYTFMNQINNVFKEEFSKIGMWSLCKKNGKYGVIDENENWHPILNRPNTNPYFAQFVFNKYSEEFNYSFKNLDKKIYHRGICERIGKYIKDNFYNFFIDENSSDYIKIRKILYKSWMSGIISQIAALLFIKEFYNKIKNIKYDFNPGNNDDFMGIDITLELIDGAEYTFQVKSGQIIKKNEDFATLSGSVNDLKYSGCTHYIYYDKKTNKLTMFENRKSIKLDGNFILIENDSIIFNNVVSFNILEMIKKLYTIYDDRDIIFKIISDNENSIDCTNNSVTIKISDIFTIEPLIKQLYDERANNV